MSLDVTPHPTSSSGFALSPSVLHTVFDPSMQTSLAINRYNHPCTFSYFSRVNPTLQEGLTACTTHATLYPPAASVIGCLSLLRLIACLYSGGANGHDCNAQFIPKTSLTDPNFFIQSKSSPPGWEFFEINQSKFPISSSTNHKLV